MRSQGQTGRLDRSIHLLRLLVPTGTGTPSLRTGGNIVLRTGIHVWGVVRRLARLDVDSLDRSASLFRTLCFVRNNNGAMFNVPLGYL